MTVRPACPPSSPQAPHRFVDADFGPWMAVRPHGEEDGKRAAAEKPPFTGLVYRNDHTGETLPYSVLADRYGPLRPVAEAPPADVAALRAGLLSAGKKAMATLAVALHQVAVRLGTQDPPADELRNRNPLAAGRPGSWEAQVLMSLVWDTAPHIPEHLADRGLLDTAAEIFQRWAASPGPYVEFAETIPDVLAPVIDSSGGYAFTACPRILFEGGTRIPVWAASRTQNPSPDPPGDGGEFPGLPPLARLLEDAPDFRYPAHTAPLGYGIVHLRTWTTTVPGVVVCVATETGGGLSVTNGAVELMDTLRATYWPERVLLLEHWPASHCYGGEEHLDQVITPGPGGQEAGWRRIWPTSADNPGHAAFEEWVRAHAGQLPVTSRPGTGGAPGHPGSAGRAAPG